MEVPEKPCFAKTRSAARRTAEGVFFTPPWILFEERRLHPIFDWSINKRLASASQAVHGPAGVMRKIDVLK
jgi:hypothetical protein